MVIGVLAGVLTLAILVVAVLWLLSFRPDHDHIVAEVQINRPAS
jgi:hypothetical protein